LASVDHIANVVTVRPLVSVTDVMRQIDEALDRQDLRRVRA
jgi:hypothetical protein